MLQIVPGFTKLEKFFKKYGIAFTLLVMYQGLFGGLSLSNKPKILSTLSSELWFKLFTMFCIAFSATQDIETSLISIALFIVLLHLLRNPEERANVSVKNII